MSDIEAKIAGLFSEAIAYGAVYFPAIANEQWDEMRDSKAEQLVSRLAALTEASKAGAGTAGGVRAPMEMCICEASRLVLRLNHPYIFTEGPECVSCRQLANAAREAYGPDGGASWDASPTPPQEAGGWLPIETAPRDATAILVMRDIWPGTKTGRAEECNGHNTYVAAWWAGERGGAGAWVCYMDSVQDPYCPIDPTHWKPLGAPPSVDQGSKAL